MRRSSFLGFIIMLALMLALSPISRAHACSCASVTDRQLFDVADVVFTGTATGRSDPSAGAAFQSSLSLITWTFRVDSIAKGSMTNPVQILSARDEASCGSSFALGTRYLVYARKVSGHLETNLCSGTRAEGQLSFTPVPSPLPTVNQIDDEGSSMLVPALGAIVVGAVLAAGFSLVRRRRRPRPMV